MARTKRWRILWHTYAVHAGNYPGYITIDGHYLYTGIRITVSKGRWVATNVLGIIVTVSLVVMVFALVFLSRNPWFLLFVLGLGAFLVFQVYLLLWSLKPNLPPR